MDKEKLYRVYYSFKDLKGNKIDSTGVPRPLDIYRIIFGESVSDAMKRFYKFYPNWRIIGVGGTNDLTDDILKQWIDFQGHK